MDHVLSFSLHLCVELERLFVKKTELSEGTLERSGLGLGHPLRSRTGRSLYVHSCLLLLLDLTSKHQQNSQMLRNKTHAPKDNTLGVNKQGIMYRVRYFFGTY